MSVSVIMTCSSQTTRVSCHEVTQYTAFRLHHEISGGIATPFLVAQHSSTAASIRSVTCGRTAEPRANAAASRSCVCDDYKIEGSCCRQDRGCLGQQKRLTIAERAGDRIPQRYLAASTGPALAPRAHRGQACLGAPAPRLAPASPGDKDFCHAQAPQMTLIGSVYVPVTGPGPWRRARTGGLCEAGWMNEGGLMPVRGHHPRPKPRRPGDGPRPARRGHAKRLRTAARAWLIKQIRGSRNRHDRALATQRRSAGYAPPALDPTRMVKSRRAADLACAPQEHRPRSAVGVSWVPALGRTQPSRTRHRPTTTEQTAASSGSRS